MSEPLLRAEAVSLSYRHGSGWLKALDAVSFEIATGETLGLAGESGCGKSTLAYQILGYHHPNSRLDGGRLLFKGTDVLAMSRQALTRLRGNRISLVPQNPTTALSPGIQVGDQVGEVLLSHDGGASRSDAAERVRALFEMVGLPDLDRNRKCYPHQLSGGQQQRVAIAMALACSPDLLVLDEPTTGLDVTTQKQILELLRGLRERVGMAMLYVTHDLGVLGEIADRVGVMYAGHMVEIAPTGVLFAQPRHPYTRGLIASRPQLGSANRQPRQALRGLLRRLELPPGCPFAPRCDYAEASCAINPQRLDLVSPDHSVACQRWRILPALVAVVGGAGREAAAAGVTEREPLLILDRVSLGYPTGSSWLPFRSRIAPVIDDLLLAIEPGETLALVGESGSGKSTVARGVSGLIAPMSGAMRFKGEELPAKVRARSNTLRREIQYIFQNPDASLNPRMTIGGILARPLQVYFGADAATMRERVARALEDVRLDAAYATRYPDQLSGGERQRVAIARAIIADPVLLLCDEVLSALDVSVQANIIELMRRLRREHHLAMLFISHDLVVVRSLADRVGVLFRGTLVEIGSTEAIFAPPFHPYTLSLLLAVPGAHGGSMLRAASAGARGPTGRGCVFAARCPWQLGRICDEEVPPWQEVGANLRIRCHIPESELRVLGVRGAIAAPAKATAVRAEPGAEPATDKDLEARTGRGVVS
jgi:peptide/nickel transport system ATP-binding protein